MDFQFEIGNHTLSSSLSLSLVVILVLMIFFIVSGNVIKKADASRAPRGFLAFLEFCYESIQNYLVTMVGSHGTKYVPIAVALASFLIIANLSGLLGLGSAPTGDYNITLSLALVAVTYSMISGARIKGLGKYLKDTIIGDSPVALLPLFIPLNIIGELAKFVSLSFRLFGNIVAGSILIYLFVMLIRWLMGVISVFAWVTIPVMAALNAYFDVFAGLMQTFVFITMMSVYLQQATAQDE